MHNKIIAFIFIALFLVGLLVIPACNNTAATRLTEDCWFLRDKLILENGNFTQKERELFLIQVMQAKGFTDEQIADEIEEIKGK